MWRKCAKKVYKNMLILTNCDILSPSKLYEHFTIVVHCRIIYTTAAYNSAYPSTLIPLQITQNNALRIILFLGRHDSTPFTFSLRNILTVRQIAEHWKIIWIFKMFHNIMLCNSYKIAASYCPSIQLEVHSFLNKLEPFPSSTALLNCGIHSLWT